MPSLEQFKDYLTSDLGFNDHQINEGAEGLAQWVKKTDRDLSSFAQLMKGCWQDICDTEDEGNGWVFDEFTRFLCIKINEDAKPRGSFTTAELRSYCEQNKQLGEKAARNFINNLFDDLKAHYPEAFTDQDERVLGKAETIESVMARLEGTDLTDSRGDVLGRACGIMLSDTFRRKDLGQFFTPREIVAFMLDLAYGKPTDEKAGIWLCLLRDPDDIDGRLVEAGLQGG
jgi:type I restriction enzyme M protein